MGLRVALVSNTEGRSAPFFWHSRGVGYHSLLPWAMICIKYLYTLNAEILINNYYYTFKLHFCFFLIDIY